MTPELSIVVVVPDHWRTSRGLLEALRRQTILERLELVLAGPDEEALDLPPEEVEGFGAVRRCRTAGLEGLGEVTAAAVRTASAPLVALTEDHCFPEPDWAESFLVLHRRGDYAGVGPLVRNANPRSVASRCIFLLEYGEFSDFGERGEAGHIPGHNSCYRRDDLLAFGDRLGWWLECETLMHWEMTARGLRLWRGEEARCRHWNASRYLPTLAFAWWFPRVFAARRAATLPRAERLRLRLLFPLIPLIRLRRLLPLAVRGHGFLGALQVAPALLGNLLVSGLSEGLGYLFGEGRHVPRAFDLEFHRERFLRAGERIGPPPDPEEAPDRG